MFNCLILTESGQYNTIQYNTNMHARRFKFDFRVQITWCWTKMQSFPLCRNIMFPRSRLWNEYCLINLERLDHGPASQPSFTAITTCMYSLLMANNINKKTVSYIIPAYWRYVSQIILTSFHSFDHKARSSYLFALNLILFRWPSQYSTPSTDYWPSHYKLPPISHI